MLQNYSKYRQCGTGWGYGRGSISGGRADLVGRRDFEIGMRNIEMVVSGSD